jgi:hypothetical protein
MQSAATVVTKKAVSSDLLHRRLGHRTVNSIMAGSINKVWADATMRWEHDNFCDGCQVVTARLANRGKSPLNVGHQEMAPESASWWSQILTSKDFLLQAATVRTASS